MQIVIQVLSQVSGIMLPFGFTFGVLIVFLWTIPMLFRFFRQIF